MFLLGGIEGGLFTWLPLHVERTVSGTTGTVALTTLMVAYVPGRFVHASLATRFRTRRYLLALAAGAAVGLALANRAFGGVGFLACVAAVGVLVSGLFPTLISVGVDAAPSYGAAVNAGLTAISYLGIAVWSPLGSLATDLGPAVTLLALPAALSVPLTGLVAAVAFVGGDGG
jgi:fucose permease